MALVLAGSAHSPPVPPTTRSSSRLAAETGVDFVVEPSRTANCHQPETMISGVAVFDFDNDGRLDIYAVNGATMPGLEKTDERYHNRLFRNQRRLDVRGRDRAKAGVAGKGYDLGVAVADYDNDGDTDLFVAGLRANILYRNEGDGTFEDVTARAGLARPTRKYGTLWAVAAAFLDYDRDGWLDLFVSNYCVWDPTTEPSCGRAKLPDYCHPSTTRACPTRSSATTATERSRTSRSASGIRAHIGKGMGIGVADFDDDGWIDVFVANDTVPNFLFRTTANGTLRARRRSRRGVAYPTTATAVSGMGADANDIDNDGRVGHLRDGPDRRDHAVLPQPGRRTFEDDTAPSGLGPATPPTTGWSNGIYDFNNDGWKDLFVACGDVLDSTGNFGEKVPQRQRGLREPGQRHVRRRAESARGRVRGRKAVHRGAAFGDLDNDGRIDVVVTDLHGPIELWRNVSPSPNNWLLVDAQGAREQPRRHRAPS